MTGGGPMAGEGPRFAGYAAVFGHVDRGGDVIAPGAFADSLKRRGTDGAVAVPLLWQHDPAQPIGVVERLSEDERGLRVVARLWSRTGVAAKAAGLLRARALNGLSFGYRVVDADAGAGGAARRLRTLDLVEVSLVSHPMQPLARVHAVEG